MAPHSSTLAWKIPWTEEPGRLQSMGLLRVGQDWATSLSLFTFMHWRRKWKPAPCSCLENPRDRGAWWAAVYGVALSQTRLKWLSSMDYLGVTEKPGGLQSMGLLRVRHNWSDLAAAAATMDWMCPPKIYMLKSILWWIWGWLGHEGSVLMNKVQFSSVA